MTTILTEIYRIMAKTIKEDEDPRTVNWFMMSSAWPVVILISSYLMFVNKIGPQIMAKRKPMKLDRIIQVYDVLQVILNSYVFFGGLDAAWLRDYSWRCQSIDRSNDPKSMKMAGLVYIYFILKVLDCLDTVFFILRKKFHQISFLHVYHHAGMVFTSWMCIRYVPGGHGTSVGLINTFVHMVMYTHYLVMSFKVFKPWWKKYITQLQIVQFLLITVHLSQRFFIDCNFPLWPIIIFLPQNLFMMVLFADFYYKTYIKQSRSEKTTIERNGTDKTQ